jgi:hypothetical protein
MIIETSVVEAAKVVLPSIGAFFAAWAGAILAFRRTKRERALDKKIAWHEQTIQALAKYEDRLDQLKSLKMNILVVKRANAAKAEGVPVGDVPKTIRVPAALWLQMKDAEEVLRGHLRLAGLYTNEDAQIDCAQALRLTVNIYTGQWMDLSAEPEVPWVEWDLKADGTANLRSLIQRSLSELLELHGLVATHFPSIAKKRLIRRIQKRMKSLEVKHAMAQVAEPQGARTPEGKK